MSENQDNKRYALHTRWWVSVLLAIVCYSTLKYLVPELHSANPTLGKLIEAAPYFAPIVTIPLLLLAAKQLYDTDRPNNKDGEKEDAENGRQD
ncbi:MAG: hypothetical protein VR65_08225 [Desulfobulbaceae bacterium BRH_c16a]|nr:MAG: hypothetical protein VR65_08225 [Desulfobulbaceae bacterium BRH_c16a]